MSDKLTREQIEARRSNALARIFEYQKHPENDAGGYRTSEAKTDLALCDMALSAIPREGVTEGMPPERDMESLSRSRAAGTITTEEYIRCILAQYNLLRNYTDPAAQVGQIRDRDWILAMASALGTDSGYDIPVVPNPDVIEAK